jgi:hypothetical protein
LCNAAPRRPLLGFDGKTHRGALIVHEDLVAEVVAIFEQLRRLRYPIEKIRTVDDYPAANDELSMGDNNTSAFNCRDIPGTGRWSLHAFGRAIDLNPLLNPYIDRTGAFQPRTPRPTSTATAQIPGSCTRRPGRARLPRSWLALGRLLANPQGLSALRAMIVDLRDDWARRPAVSARRHCPSDRRSTRNFCLQTSVLDTLQKS